MNHKYLRLTSSLNSIYFYYFFSIKNKNIHEWILGSFLLPNCIILSQFFWNNPIKNSLIHKLDSIFAKTTILYSSIYNLFIKKSTLYYKLEYFFLLLCLIYFAKNSHYYSSIEWCCINHLYNHSFIHLIMIFGTIITFLQSSMEYSIPYPIV